MSTRKHTTDVANFGRVIGKNKPASKYIAFEAILPWCKASVCLDSTINCIMYCFPLENKVKWNGFFLYGALEKEKVCFLCEEEAVGE